jgi:hypothetical protein
MRKILISFAALLLVFGFCDAAHSTPSYTYNFNYLQDGNGGLTSPISGAQVETFDNGASGGYDQSWFQSGNCQIVSGSTGQNAAPYNPFYNGGAGKADSTYYLTVPAPGNLQGDPTLDSVTANFGSKRNYLGLWWGSQDGYNGLTLTLTGSNGSSITISGSDIGIANGDQKSAATNEYVNIFTGNFVFNEVTFSSTNYAFEIDNVAVAFVPEPCTMLLLGCGFAGLGIYRRSKIK